MRRLQKPPKQKLTNQSLRQLLDTTKRDTRLLGDCQRLLLGRTENAGRETELLHVSEISHNDWCPRASYYRLAGVKPDKELPPTHWRMKMIWDEGTDIHKKWQSRFWDIDRLDGMFHCLQCEHDWWDHSPDHCPQCLGRRHLLRYDEVPLVNLPLRLIGHADGQDGDLALIEIKSIGKNSLLWEAPQLLEAHTYKLNLGGGPRTFLDYDGLWDSIRTPFPSHIRQGTFYGFLSGITDMIFIYECKWNQRTKEMVVKYREERIADRLAACRQICLALDGGEIPACPQGGCTDCQRYEKEADASTRPRYRLQRPPADAPASQNRIRLSG